MGGSDLSARQPLPLDMKDAGFHAVHGLPRGPHAENNDRENMPPSAPWSLLYSQQSKLEQAKWKRRVPIRT
jgi:hypothetical protein